MSTLRKQRDELLVCGYLRENTPCDIPDDIINICTKWYHVDAFFEKAGATLTINEEKILSKEQIYPVLDQHMGISLCHLHLIKILNMNTN